MGSAGDFAETDRQAAENFGAAARSAGVKRIIYLGGLGSRSRRFRRTFAAATRSAICSRASGVPVIELRASVIIGSGSLSFEMVRALTERLPVLVTPRWVRVPHSPSSSTTSSPTSWRR